MKKLIVMLLCCLMLTACAAPDNTNSTEHSTLPFETTQSTGVATEASTAPSTEAPTEAPTESSVVKFTLYTPAEDAMSFYETEILIDHLDAQSVLSELMKENVLPEDVLVNSEKQEGTQLNIDLNSAFSDLIASQGTAGEKMIIGSVVNSLLSAYETRGVETIYITIDGEILESGHVVYDFPMTFVS